MFFWDTFFYFFGTLFFIFTKPIWSRVVHISPTDYPTNTTLTDNFY